MNFFPLWTAIVCPIISGTIVDRRDHVFTTFFSFREFSPSTFSRRCPSTNGPFLSERAIASLLLYAAQPPPLGVPHLLKPAHRTGHTMGLRTERANEARTQRVRYAFHDHRPARLAQLVENRLGWRDHSGRWLRDGLCRRWFCCPLRRPLYQPCPACGGACSCRSHGFGSPSRLCDHQPGSAFLARSTLGALVQDRAPSLRFSALSLSRKTSEPKTPHLRLTFAISHRSESADQEPITELLLTTLHDHAIGALVLTRLLAERRESPRRHRVITLHAAFTTAVRMIHGVHGHAANGRFLAAPTRAARLAIGLILVVEIANLADRGHAIDREPADFAGRHLHERIVALLAEKLRRSTSRANGLAAATGIEFEIVHHRAGRNVADLQGVARKNIRIFAGRNRCADFEPHGVENVALFAVGIVQQGDVRAAVRVVFDGFHLGGNAMLVAAEIDHAVLLLVAAATVPN